MKTIYLNPLRNITEALKRNNPDVAWRLPTRPDEPTHFAVETEEDLNALLKTIMETNRE